MRISLTKEQAVTLYRQFVRELKAGNTNPPSDRWGVGSWAACQWWVEQTMGNTPHAEFDKFGEFIHVHFDFDTENEALMFKMQWL